MATNFNDQFVGAILDHLFGRADAVRDNTVIVKRHTDKLALFGDYSFPVDVQNWNHALLSTYDNHKAAASCVRTVFDLRDMGDAMAAASTDDSIDKHLNALRRQLQDRIQSCTLQQNRVVLHLNRRLAFACLPEILRSGESYGAMLPKRTDGGTIFVRDCEGGDDMAAIDVTDSKRTITEYRCTLLRRVLINLIKYSKYHNVVAAKDADYCLKVSHRSTEKETVAMPNTRLVICGVVKESNGQDKKMSGMLAGEFLRTRQMHMELMAQHKYGVRFPSSNDDDISKFAELSRQLGIAAVTFDLLEVKHSSPVTLSMQQHCGGASRGAAFVLYNSARIEKLLATYAHQLAAGHYAPPGDVEQSDWSLLKEEEEWQLMFNYVLEFPNIVIRSLGNIEAGQIATHLICAFLSGLARCFSVYYRRVRILDYNRKHLMDTLHCRMRLVLAVRNVLNQALAMLNVQPVQRM